MKSLARLTKFLQTRKSLFMILVVVLNQTVFAQDDGYWDNRLRLQNYSDAISAIAVKDSNIFIDGGNSALIWNGKHWEERLAIVNRSVIILAIIENDLYVGGDFTTVGSTYPLGPNSMSANHIAKWNFVTKSWSALESYGNNGVNGTVRALAVCGNRLYVGGEFTMAGGVPANGIAVWKDSSKTWMPLGQGVNGTVRAIVASGKNLYVGGTFTLAGGKPANNIAKWDGKEWVALGGGVNHQVNAITLFGQDLYVGGYFTKAGDVNANNIAKWNTSDKSWSALGVGTKNGVYNTGGISNVYAIAANDRALFVGGTFNMAGDQSANNIAKWDPVNNTWSPLGSGLGGQAFAIAAQGREVYVGGGFTYAGGKRSDRFAIWHEPNAPPVIAALPELRFNEDKTLLYPIRNWYTFTDDIDDTDSMLIFNVLSGKNVKAIRQTGNFRFSAPANWFGKDTLQLIVKDPDQLADTTALMVTVNPVNDAPKISGLPDSLIFKKGGSTQLKLWDYVEDVETPDRQLTYTFSTSNSSLLRKFDYTTGVLVLTAPQFHGRAQLFINVSDSKASAQDTVAVRVELPTDVASPREAGLPTAFHLWPNSPNPFNPGTTIRFDTPSAGRVKLAVYTLRGELVQTLVDGEMTAGAHQLHFDGRNLASGVYFYRMETASYIMTRKMLLQK